MVSVKKNALFNIIKTILSVALPLITFPYVSKVIQPENIGKVNWSISFVGYFSLIASLGISTYAIRECSSFRDSREDLSESASQIFSINLITTIISYVFLILSFVLFKKITNYKLLVFIQSFNIVLTTFGVDWLFQTVENFKFITIRTIISQLIYFVSIFVFIKTPNDYIKYSIISVVTSSGCYISNFFFVRKYCDIHFTFKINWKRHMTPIIELFIMQLAQIVIANTDIIMLGLINGDYEVGIYSFAMSITNMIAQITGSILWVMLPRLSYLFSKDDYNEINKMLSDVFGFFMVLGLPCFTGIVMMGGDIILYFVKDSYIDSIPVLIILMFSFLFSLFGDAFFGNMVLLPSGKEKIYMKICCVTAIFNIAINYILISGYSFIGAALSAVLTSLLTMILIFMFKDKRIKIDSFLDRILSPVIGCASIIAVCIIIKTFVESLLLRLIFSIPLSIISYFIVLIIMKNYTVIDLMNSGINAFKCIINKEK